MCFFYRRREFVGHPLDQSPTGGCRRSQPRFAVGEIALRSYERPKTPHVTPLSFLVTVLFQLPIVNCPAVCTVFAGGLLLAYVAERVTTGRR